MGNDTGEQPVTRLLHAAARGESHAAEELLPLVYDELRKLAQARMGSALGGPGHTLQATALVHEAYARLVVHILEKICLIAGGLLVFKHCPLQNQR